MKYLLFIIFTIILNSCTNNSNCDVCKATIDEPSKEELAKFKSSYK